MTATRAWFDVALLAYLCLFFYLEAIFLRRETKLGWAMFVKCLFLGSLFGYTVVFTLLNGQVLWCWCAVIDPPLIFLRVGIALSLTWAIVEMVRGNMRHDDHWP